MYEKINKNDCEMELQADVEEENKKLKEENEKYRFEELNREAILVLKEADLVRDKRDGKFIIYELNASVLEEIMLWIKDLKGENIND